MKSISIAIIILASVICLSFSSNQSGMSSPTGQDTISPTKDYCVSFKYAEWVSIMQSFEYVKQKVKLSDIPSKDATVLMDSIIQVFQSAAAIQINRQVAADSAKPKPVNKTP